MSILKRSEIISLFCSFMKKRQPAFGPNIIYIILFIAFTIHFTNEIVSV